MKPSKRWRMNHEQELRNSGDLSPCSPSTSSCGDNSIPGKEIRSSSVIIATGQAPSQISSSKVRVITKVASSSLKKRKCLNLNGATFTATTQLPNTPHSKTNAIASWLTQSHSESSPSSPFSTDTDMEIVEITSVSEMKKRPSVNCFHHLKSHCLDNLPDTTTTVQHVYLSPLGSSTTISNSQTTAHPSNSFYPGRCLLCVDCSTSYSL